MRELAAVGKIYSFLKEINSDIESNYTKTYVGFKIGYSKGFVFTETKPDTLTLKLM